jgi:hypothetical protein
MNFRIILVVFVILAFATFAGALNFISEQGINLEQAYREGSVKITQETPAGTIPHQVNVVNKGKDSLEVQKGYILSSNTSQNLVIAQDQVISPGSNASVLAYCIEPEQKAKEGSQLTVPGKAPQMVQDIIINSNPQNPSDALNTQIKLWVLLNGEKFNLYQGESLYIIKEQGLSSSNMRENISAAKVEIMSQFNLTNEQFISLSNNSSILNNSSITNSQSWIDQLINWIKGYF